MQSILIIHQSSELYGSDKTILFFCKELDKTKYFPVVVLPSDGPLKKEFDKENIKVVIAPVLKLYRNIINPKNIITFCKDYYASMKILKKLHTEHNFQLVYSHTLAVLIGFFFAKKNNIKHLWHVQEIIDKPVFVNKAFKKLLSLKANHKAIYDSIETMKFWTKDSETLQAKSDFVWNGLNLEEKYNTSQEEIKEIREHFFKADNHQIVIGLIGRINGWKGQQLLLEAYKLVRSNNEYQNTKLVFVGSAPPNQDFFVEDLNSKIQQSTLWHDIIIVPFQQNIWKFWDSIDIAVVPSTEPEPFGMVAIEAMAAKKPTIVAKHGGLQEIVIHDETGFLFEPRNPADLAKHLKLLIDNESKRKTFGENGYLRVENVFSMKKHTDKLENIFQNLI